MKLVHFSDNHGLLPDLPYSADVWVSSGDFLPNRTLGGPVRCLEEPWQVYWLEDNKERLKRWFGDMKFLISHGNHDFIDVAEVLRTFGVDAVNLDDATYLYKDVSFAGFPYIPWWSGQWNRETGAETLALLTEDLDLEDIDVLVAHSPINGVLDLLDVGHVGSMPMRTKLLKGKHSPKLYLHGHIHPANGIQGWSNGIMVSNAATTHRVITL